MQTKAFEYVNVDDAQSFFFKVAKGINKFKLVLSSVVLFFCLIFCVQSAIAAPPSIPNLPPKPIIDPGRINKERDVTKKPRGLIKPGTMLEKPLKEDEVKAQPSEDVDAIKFRLNEIVLTGVSVYKKGELLKYYKPYLGKDVSFSDLQKIANTITIRYRKDGYVISRAIIPAQQVELGKVQIEVIEGYISTVYVEGDISKVRAQLEACGEKIKKMRPLQIKRLERYILLLNDIPGLEVKTVLSPSVEIVGAADITLVVTQNRVDGEVYYDNRGSRYMGPGQAIGMVSVNDFIGGADNLSLQTIDTPLHGELRYLQLGYEFPLGINGVRINVSGSLVETSPGFILDEFDLIGRSKSWGVELEYPLLRSRTKNLWLRGKFDFLDTQTNFPTGTLSLFADHIRSLRFGVSYDFIDGWLGSNLIDFELSKGLHVLGASPLEPKTQLSRDHGLSDYTKAELTLSRYQSLGKRWLLVGSASGQYSFNGQLLSAEEFSFGGNQFGRAYDPSEIAGDTGIASKLELRANTYPNWKLLQQIQYYTFYEIGVVWNIGGNDFEQPAKDSGADVGGGLRVTFNEHLYGNIELAKPLTRQVDSKIAAGKYGNAWRLYFGLGVRL
ncbi:MAG: hypothetical protein KKE11_05635 [Gammaproteobacteria bacterium]|nr:hypothetical protein [Gammaproteobacteria bacterium]